MASHHYFKSLESAIDALQGSFVQARDVFLRYDSFEAQ